MSATPPEPDEGQNAHFRNLEALYQSAPVNGQFCSELKIIGRGRAQIMFAVDESSFHAAGAAHGTLYFKMLDDAAFYAANSLISDRFLLTTASTCISPSRCATETRRLRAVGSAGAAEC